MKKKRFSVWVSDGEVNDNLMTYENAVETAEEWIKKGYGDEVVIDEYVDGTNDGRHRFLKIVNKNQEILP